MPDWLDAAALQYPEKTAMSFGERSWTYRQLLHSTVATESLLRDVTRHGEGRIGVLASNRPGYVMLLHACRRAGAEIVPLNWRLSAPEIAWQVRAAKVKTAFVDEATASLAGESFHGESTTILSLEELEDVSPRTESKPPGVVIDLSRPAAVLFTSGTSGRPKGALLTNGNFWFSAVGSALRLGQRADDVWLASLSFFHIGGLSIVLRACIGALPVIVHERFDPHRALTAIDGGATHVSVVPVMLRRMIELRGSIPWPPHLRCLLVGGSSTPASLIDECVRLSLPIAPTYGLTETASQVATLLPQEVATRRGSSGLPLPTIQVRIANSSGQIAANAVGEIEVRGPTVFAGYLDEPPTGQVADQWFRTGDVGFQDEDGVLHVVDRRSDLIVSGGENIYPAEIELALMEHENVVDAGVVSVASDEWGARPAAAVVWGGESLFSESVLREFLRERLAAYKVPDRIVVLEAVPRSTSGKLLRRELQGLLSANAPDS